VIKIAIVDDDSIYIDTIREYLSKYSMEYDVDFKIDSFFDGDDLTKNYKPKYDIIFLDIQMKFMDGISTAEHIRKHDNNVILIFITNMAQYAIKGYTVNALSFLLKPVSYFAFSQELNRSILKINNSNKHFIIIKNKDGVIKLDSDTILFVESFKHRLIVHTEKGEHSYVGTLKELEKELPKRHFHRCNNGYLVNLVKVTSIKNNIVYIDDYELMISRPRKKEFLAVLTNYIGGVEK
jgi:DNA-binding LytR/AlgR family response regulator